VTEKSYDQVLNDVLGVPGQKEQLDVRLVRSAQKQLERCGYRDWLSED